MVRFGIIGAGIIARKFADACKQSKGAQLMAIASTSMERANQFAQTFNVPKLAKQSYVKNHLS